jgi:FkbM family methyltransferase
MGAVKRAVRRLGRAAGVELSRSHPLGDPWRAMCVLLATTQRPILFDVGANTGQTLRQLLRTFPRAEIHCFEPNPDVIPDLHRMARRHADVHLHQLAFADSAGPRTLHTNVQFTHEGSLLERPKDGRRYYQEAFTLPTRLQVDSERIDAFCDARGTARLDLLKLDIQGGEMMALRGATGLLARMAVELIYLEVSFVPLYEASPLYHEIAAFLGEFDYSLYGLYHLFFARNGQLRYCDALFASAPLRRRVIDTFPPEP